MYKVLSVLVILIILFTPPVVGQNTDFSSQINNLLTTVFNDLEIKGINVYIAKTKDEKLYLDKGSNAPFSVGDNLLVVRPFDLLKDPITQETLGTIDKKLAVISIIEVNENYSVAELKEEISDFKIKTGDKVLSNKEHLQILLAQFKAPKELEELTSNIEGKFYSYLTRKKLFEVNSIAISTYRQLNEVEETADYLITGEVYESRDEIFLKVELYDNDTGLIAAEEVISFNNKNEIITYYREKKKKKNTGYKLLFKSNSFAGPSYNLAWGSLEQGDLVINQGSNLKLMNYNEPELITEYTIENYKRTKYDDYNLVVGDVNQKQGNEIFVENYNYPLQFEKNGAEYEMKILKRFNRNRPKLIATINDRTYLITRDYKGLLKFNLWQKDEFVTDFKLEVKKNEGYRVSLADLNNDQQQEVVVSSYQKEKGYRLKIYNLDYKFQTEIEKIVGAEFVIANLNNNSFPEIYGYDQENNKIVVFEMRDGDYQKVWQSKKLPQDIVDLTTGDINQDGVQELLILVNNDNQSKIYTYHYQTVK